MHDGFEVDPNHLNTHAGTVDEFAGRTDTAVDAGRHVAGLDDAYGLFCRAFPLLLKEPQQRGADTLAETASIMHETASQLRASALLYEEVDNKVLAAIEALVKAMDRTYDIQVAGGGD